MRAVFFRHNPNPLGTFPGIFERAGFECTILDTWRDGIPAEFDPLEPDILIVMGGAPGAYQAHLYPFLQREIEILEARLAVDRPTLGVCLGAQLMAGALGARNYKGTNGREIGWYNLRLTPEGGRSVARHFSPTLTKVAESHGDTFDLPEGAVLLASSEKYPNQIFSWGRNGIALQPHPEADAAGCKGWEVSYSGALEEEGIDIEAWRAETARCLPVMMRQTEIFLREWIGGLTHA